MTYFIYADDTLFLNTVINYFLLLGTLLLTRLPVRRLRILLSAFLSSLYSLFALLPTYALFYILPLRFAFAFLFVFLATGFQKRAVRAGFLFIFLSLLFGGIISAMTWISHSSSFLTLSHGVYLPSTLRVAAVISALLYYVILRFFKLLLPPTEAAIRQITLQNGSSKFSLSLLVDTGSQLYDPIRNTPIPVVEKSSLRGYFTETEYQILISHSPVEALSLLSPSPHHFGLLPITTASGSILLLTFRSFLQQGEESRFSPSTIALSEGTISPREGIDGVIGI